MTPHRSAGRAGNQPLGDSQRHARPRWSPSRLATQRNFSYSWDIDSIDRPQDATSRAKQVVGQVILDVVASVPPTREVAQANPRERARVIQTAAALKAAAVSGTLALPPGPWGLAVVIPDLVAVWRIQAKMVSDIAGVYGQSAALSQEHLLYCLFRHAAAQIVRDLTARVGERIVFQRATLRVLQTVAERLGMKVSQRAIAKGAARWLPVVGSIGVAGYAYYDTAQVASTAIHLFSDNLGFPAKQAASA